MDEQDTLPRVIKHRRRYTADFKTKVLAECEAPGASVAGVAISHGINPNLVQTWRRLAKPSANTDSFVALPMPMRHRSRCWCLARRKPRKPMSGPLPPLDGPVYKRWFMTSSLLGRAKWPEPSLMTGTAIWSATITGATKPASNPKTTKHRQR